MTMTNEEIARVAHDANQTYMQVRSRVETCKSGFVYSWNEASEHNKASMIAGVGATIERLHSGQIVTPRESHERWLAYKQEAGWKYGPAKSEAKKEHPCIMAWSDLSEVQRGKDRLFLAIVSVLAFVGRNQPD